MSTVKELELFRKSIQSYAVMALLLTLKKFGNMETPTRKIDTWMTLTGLFPSRKLPPMKIPTQTIPTEDNSHPGLFLTSYLSPWISETHLI